MTRSKFSNKIIQVLTSNVIKTIGCGDYLNPCTKKNALALDLKLSID